MLKHLFALIFVVRVLPNPRLSRRPPRGRPPRANNMSITEDTVAEPRIALVNSLWNCLRVICS